MDGQPGTGLFSDQVPSHSRGSIKDMAAPFRLEDIANGTLQRVNRVVDGLVQLRGVTSAFVVSLLIAAACDAHEDAASNTLEVARSDFGNAWPLTVGGGTLRCTGAGAVTFEAEGTVYEVNGLAGTQNLGADIDPIWEDAGHGLKKNIGPLINRGLKLCKE